METTFNSGQDSDRQDQTLSLRSASGDGQNCFSLQGIQQARLSTPKVANADPQELVAVLMKVSSMIGSPPPNTAEYIILRDEIIESPEINRMNLGEIILSYRLAIAGHLDVPQQDLITYGKPLTVFGITKVVQAYRRWAIGHLASSQQDEDHDSRPDEDHRKKIMIEGTIRCYTNWKGTGEIVDYGNTVHNFLYINKFIHRDEEDIANLKEESRRILANDIAEMASGKKIYVLKDAKARIDRILSGDDEDAEKSIRSVMRRLSLKYYFEELEFSDQDLEQLLKAKNFTEYKLEKQNK